VESCCPRRFSTLGRTQNGLQGLRINVLVHFHARRAFGGFVASRDAKASRLQSRTQILSFIPWDADKKVIAEFADFVSQ
jgi:hypothetical protein